MTNFDYKFIFKLSLPYTIAALLVGPLILLRIPTTFNMNFFVEKIDFTFQKFNRSSTPLFANIDLLEATFANFDTITIAFDQASIGSQKIDGAPSLEGAEKRIKIIPQARLAQVTFKDIKLEDVLLESKSRIQLGVSDNADAVLQIAGAPSKIAFYIGKQTIIESSNCKTVFLEESWTEPWQKIELKNQQSSNRVVFSSALNEPFLLNFRTANSRIALAQDVDLTDLKFVNIDGPMLYPTVRDSSKVFFIDYDAEPISISRNDFVKVDKADKFRLVDATLDHGTLRVNLVGKAKKLFIGPLENQKNYAPSILEWLHKNHPLVLYVNSIIALASILKLTINQYKSTTKKGNEK